MNVKFTDADVVARNYKYMDAIAARQSEEAEPQRVNQFDPCRLLRR